MMQHPLATLRPNYHFLHDPLSLGHLGAVNSNCQSMFNVMPFWLLAGAISHDGQVPLVLALSRSLIGRAG